MLAAWGTSGGGRAEGGAVRPRHAAARNCVDVPEDVYQGVSCRGQLRRRLRRVDMAENQSEGAPVKGLKVSSKGWEVVLTSNLQSAPRSWCSGVVKAFRVTSMKV